MANSDRFDEIFNSFTNAEELQEWAEVYDLSDNTAVVDRINQLKERDIILKFNDVVKLREWAILNNCLHHCQVRDRMIHLETNMKDIGLKVGLIFISLSPSNL